MLIGFDLKNNTKTHKYDDFIFSSAIKTKRRKKATARKLETDSHLKSFELYITRPFRTPIRRRR